VRARSLHQTTPQPPLIRKKSASIWADFVAKAGFDTVALDPKTLCVSLFELPVPQRPGSIGDVRFSLGQNVDIGMIELGR
jgi:hypothetical protein